MKAYIWGTGIVTKKLLERGIRAEIKAFIETHKTKGEYMGIAVVSPEEIDQDYEAIIIANTFSEEVYLCAQKEGIDINKMIFMRPCLYVNPRENLPFKKKILGEKSFEIYIAEFNIFEESFYVSDRAKYDVLNKRPSFKLDEANDYPIIKDRYDDAGKVDNYFWQDLWAARLIYQNKPEKHYDIGSRLDGFIAHMLVLGIPVKMIDIRPFPETIEGLDTIVDDATELREFEDESIESLSALCSLEHFGLGRYGDPIDPEACFKCFENIQKKLKIGGRLYIGVPIGKERVCFNAHRCFNAQTIVDCFSKLKLLEFSCAAGGKLEKDVDLHKYDETMTRDGNYRFGLFYFVKSC